jgi:hypothetical protein
MNGNSATQAGSDATYIFAVKDTLDTCNRAVVSD